MPQKQDADNLNYRNICNSDTDLAPNPPTYKNHPNILILITLAAAHRPKEKDFERLRQSLEAKLNINNFGTFPRGICAQVLSVHLASGKSLGNMKNWSPYFYTSKKSVC